ncbi:hypothetical protein ACST14_02320 [Aquirufa sp. A-Brett2-15D]
MKKSLTFIFLFVSVIAFSQNNGINFQGVGRNSSGVVLANTKISLRFSVIQSSETGTVEYVESKEVTTNAQGIFSVVIGDGTQISKTGNFSDINWKINPKFLKVEMDPAGETSFVAMGTTRLQSVPFAYYANGVNADNVDGVLSASKGGTGVASISALKTALAIDQINNTSDLSKPISTATQAALDTKVSTSTFSTTLAAKANVSDLDLKANIADVALKANATDLAFKAPIDSPTFTGTVAGITKAMVGLGSVDNTSDLTKPISTAAQTALDTKVSTLTFSTTIATKENSANKSSAIDLGGINPSDVLFPTQKAVKTYVDGQINSGGVADGGITTIKIADGAVTNEKVADGSISWRKLNIAKGDIVGLGFAGDEEIIIYQAGQGLTQTTTSIPNGRRTGSPLVTTTFDVMPINESLILDGAVSDVKIATGVSKSKVGLSNVENTALSTWTGSNYLTTLGTINSGTWSGTAINYSKLNLIGSIVSSDISSSAAINYSKLNLTNSIVSGDLTSAAITTSKLADGAITNSKISEPISVVNGGTGTSTLVTNSVIIGNGTSTVQFVAPGNTGNVLTSNGASWISSPPSNSNTYSLGLNSTLGGIVFYLTPDNKHGLVVEEMDQCTSCTFLEAENVISNPTNHSTNGKNFTDWRLPTVYELLLINNTVGYKAPSTFYNIANFNGGANRTPYAYSSYWSSTKYTDNGNDAEGGLTGTKSKSYYFDTSTSQYLSNLLNTNLVQIRSIRSF